jgi:two-component system, NarL family, invasion response regulator UvrY
VHTVPDAVGVLIVDDQEAFRSAARLVVELTDGFTVAGEAATGEEGVVMAADLRPGLVLMDMNLPGIDGPEATRQILANNPSVKVIGLSTYEEYETRALEAGAVAFVSKEDFEPGRLLDAWALAAD